MQMLPFSKIRNLVIVIALLILSGGIGYRLGQRGLSVSLTPAQRVVINQNPTPQSGTIDFSLFWDVWGRLFRYYIDASSLQAEKMVEGAISGMVSSIGDPYTMFFPPKENKEFKEDLGGSFEGIGAQLEQKDGRIIVMTPLKGSPAEKSGIKPSDWIMKVNNEETGGWTVEQAVTKIRGPRGTTVTLAILHDGSKEPVDIAITRDTIAVPSVESWVKDVSDITEISQASGAAQLRLKKARVAYLRLSRFGDRTNDEWNQAVSAIAEAAKNGGAPRGLILDLRNNPGGYLDGSVFIASEFVRSGTIVTQVNSDGTKEVFSVNRRGRLLDIPMIVLVNKGSASAAEIVAGALHDLRRATLVGEGTFGKGTVQTPQELRGGASIHITTGKWLLPSGASITKVGVKPDVVVKLDSDVITGDTQLAKAIELLLK